MASLGPLSGRRETPNLRTDLVFSLLPARVQGNEICFGINQPSKKMS